MCTLFFVPVQKKNMSMKELTTADETIIINIYIYMYIINNNNKNRRRT